MAVCRMPDEEVAEVRRLLETEPKVDRTYKVDLVDAAGVVHASVEKVVNVRKSGPTPDPAPVLATATQPEGEAWQGRAAGGGRAPGKA